MLLISKEERDYLEKQGCVWGDELHRTRSNKKTYYATCIISATIDGVTFNNTLNFAN